jgi:hypothetical protein
VGAAPKILKTRRTSIRSPLGRSCRRANCWATCCWRANQPAAALAEYERSLNATPNRFHGAAAAAERAGDAAKAKLYREKLVQVAAAESDRPELLTAKRFLAEH